MLQADLLEPVLAQGSTSLALPWPPTINTYWRHASIGGFARVFISKEGKQYRDEVIRLCLAQNAPKHLGGRLAVRVEAFPPDRRARDLDNLFKGLLDALTHAKLWHDDEQIDDLSIRRGQIVKGGKVVVTVEGFSCQ